MKMYPTSIFQTDRPPVDERADTRVGLYLPVSVLRPGSPAIGARLTDISQQGCKIAADVNLKVGTEVAVDVPGFSWFAGTVVWQTRKSLGVDFATSVSRAEVAYVVELAVRSG